ncbi:serine hydrolase domain-containing protein [Kribbella sp. NPDC051936]|uniref:serine hydrolase domain-containing protein n=1 Tax=Kribbella sp. NPDC051936 TaxID=3154946 RepID=UPI00342EEAAB
MNRTEVHGWVAGGFEQVREAFAEVVKDQDGHAGSQLAVYLRGTRTVDLWAGDDVGRDTLTGVYSSTKGAATLLIALLVQEGTLDLDDPVVRHWPEFAGGGRDTITVRDVLTHRSGMIGVEGGLPADELADDAVIARRLATQRPYWRPGSMYGYGGFVSFAIVGEVIRRVTGRSLQQIYDERIRIPYGLDLYLGLPEAEEGRYRPIQQWIATPEQEAAFWTNVPGPHSILGVSYGLNSRPPLDQVAFANTRAVRANGQVSAGGVASAGGLAGLYSAAVWGMGGQSPFLDPGTVAAFAQLHSVGGDLVRGSQGNYALGFQAKGLRYPFLGANAFGHDGSAGAESFADPVSGIAFGYARRRFGFGWSYPEHDRLAAAVHVAATTG